MHLPGGGFEQAGPCTALGLKLLGQLAGTGGREPTVPGGPN